MNDHYIICGYGSTGRSAIRALRAQGVGTDRFVVIEPHPGTADEAAADGFVTVQSDAASTAALRTAEIDRAAAVVVTPNRDDTSVLVTLTARELNARVPIVVAVRNEDNLHLLTQSGADSVIHSADAVGRLLGMATTSQPVARVLDDLLSPGSGLDVVEIDAVELPGGGWGAPVGARPLAVLRDGADYDIDLDRPIERGDRIVVLTREAGD